MRKGDPVYGEMSGSSRRRSSKWDLQEESRVPLDSVHEKSWSGKSDLSLLEKESERGWLSPEPVSGNRPKWSVPEPLPGRRGSRRNDSIGEDHHRSLKRGMTTWEGEESYGTRMSPGLDEWRHNSPRFEWKRAKRSRSQSRSRSRSVDRGFGKESGLIDRSRSRPVASAQICKDFAAGRCRRGNHCQFLHQDGQSYEDNWGKQRNTVTSKNPVHNDSRDYSTGSGRSTHLCSDFLKGNCRRGASCRFDHHVASQLPGKDPSSEATREKNNDGRHRDATPERHGNRETRQLPPCKFFAAGNCRNGKYCRFSHQDQAHASPERSRDDRFSHDRNFDDFGKVWNGAKWSTTSTSGAGKLNEDKSRTDGAPDQSGAPWAVDNRWGPHLDDKTLHESLADHRMGGSEIKGTLLRSVRNGGDHELGSEQRADESWIGDMDMSPEWNYNVRASNQIDKQHTHGHPNVIQEESGQRHDANAIIPSLVNNSSAKPVDHNFRDLGKSSLPHDDNSVPEKIVTSHGSNFSNIMPSNSFNQNSVNSSVLPLSGVIMGGQSQNHLNQTLLNEDGMVNKPGAVKGPQNMVSSEHLTQLTNISASLAQLLAQGQQLPELYAAHTSVAHNSSEIPSVVYPEDRPQPESTVTTQTNETVRKQNRYDPISDSIGFEKHDGNGDPQGITPDLIRQENTTNVKPEILSKNSLPSSVTGTTNDSSSSKVSSLEAPNNKSHQTNQLGPGAFSKETKENNGVLTEESRKLEGDKMALENNDPAGNIDGDGKNDDGKRGKDAKGVRAFKFALVEFVKDLLKPTWKEGQMSKDVYKNVVKKVVDKVTGTVQAASIPQTPDKIQQYLSLSKPKLTKLVQAYVEKLQKDK